MTLGEILRSTQSRDNNFNLLRFCAAVAVVLAHSFALYDLRDSLDAVWIAFGTGMGDLAVNVFFVASGFLIARSWLSRRAIVPFVWARCVRIFPALWVSTILLVLLAGAFFSPLGFQRFIALPTTLEYVAHNATMLPTIGAEMNLPSAIGYWEGAFNTPLWTLPHEIQMYAFAALLGLFGALGRGWVVSSIAAGSFALWVAADAGLVDGSSRFRLMFHFFAGAWVLHHASLIDLRRSLWPCAGLLFLAVLLIDHDYREYLLGIGTPFVVFWFAYVPQGRIRLFNKVGDYSYGTYIWAYPIQVALFYYLGDRLGVWGHVAASLGATLAVALASWHLLERRALSLPVPLWLRGRVPARGT